MLVAVRTTAAQRWTERSTGEAAGRLLLVVGVVFADDYGSAALDQCGQAGAVYSFESGKRFAFFFYSSGYLLLVVIYLHYYRKVFLS